MGTDQGVADTPLELINAYLPQSYDVSLKIDSVKPNYQGTVIIPLLKNELFNGNSREPFALTLHAHKLVITNADLHTSDGGQVKLKTTYDRVNQQVTFSSSESISAVELSISFLGSVTPIKTFHNETYGVFKTNYSDSVQGRSDNYVIATHAQPFGCRSIFPVVDELTYKVPIALAITAKSSFKFVSNAMIESSKILDMTENSVVTFKPTPPIAPSVFGFVVGDLEMIENASLRMPIRAYVTKGDASLINYALKTTASLLPQFENVLGCNYPLEKLDIVALPFLSDAVMENWGMITAIKDTVFLDEATAMEEEKSHVRQLIAHQLTHQWIGNYVSVDEWEYTWLIESFATFVGNYILAVANISDSDCSSYELSKSAAIQDFMDIDCFVEKPIQSFHGHMNRLNINQGSRTNSIFERDFYEKGMILINMIAFLFKLESPENDMCDFFKAFSHVLSKFAHKTVKPFEIWSVLDEHSSYDILAFVHAWTRHEGYPCVVVKVENDKIIVEQNRFIYNGNAADFQLENTPYHVPLAMKLRGNDGKVKIANLMLTDRSMDLDVPISQFLSLNYNNQFYYKTIYVPEIQTVILENFYTYTALDLIGLIKDYGKILGQQKDENFNETQLLFLMRICDKLTEESVNIDFEVLKCALGYVEIINSIFVHFTPYTNFQRWLDSFASKLYQRLGNWGALVELQTSEYNSTEFDVRNIILQLASRNKEAQIICRKLYKNLVNSGVTQKFVPKELYSSLFNVTMATASMNEYKQILSLVKNGDVSFLRHTNGTANEVQTAALSSLSFCQKQELLSKTLHFVDNNIDSKLIEVALIGYKYKPDAEHKQLIWAWYKVHYDRWIKRSLRKGSDWSKQIGVTVGNITRLVLGEVMQYKTEEVAKFVSEKLKFLPPHQLKERYDAVMLENEERVHIAAYYDKIM